MPIQLGATGITFHDNSVQTTAAGGAPTTAQVLSATAGASAGAVGTYAFLGFSQATSTGSLVFGTNYSGSNLVPAALFLALNVGWDIGQEEPASSGRGGSTQSGTWKSMSSFSLTNKKPGGVFLRVA